MMTDRAIRMYEYVVECGVATPEELNLAFNMTDMGWEDTIDRVIYIRTGYNDYNQWIEEEDNE